MEDIAHIFLALLTEQEEEENIKEALKSWSNMQRKRKHERITKEKENDDGKGREEEKN